MPLLPAAPATPRSSLPARLFSRVFLAAAALAAFAAVVLSAAPAAQAQQPAAEDAPVIDEIVAVVDDNIVLRSEIEAQMQAVLSQRRQRPGAPLPPRARLWEQVLESRIDENVMAAHARRDTTVSISASQLDRVLEQRIDGLARRAGGRDQLERAYGRSINELKADFEDPVRQQLLAEQFRQRRLNKVRITPSEVREWFEGLPQDSLPQIPTTVELAHIVRYPEATASARRQAEDVINAIRDSARAGVPIEDLARRYSDDGSAPQGGRIQSTLGELVPSFAAVVSRAPLGEITRVFRTPFGYHVARVNERSGNRVDYNHVLIEVDASTARGTEAREFLGAVRDSIVDQGAPFGLMARRHSEEESSAGRGGRVAAPRSGETTLVLDELGSSWKRTLRGLDEGEVSTPSEVRLIGPQQRRAIHLLKLQERTPAHRMNVDQDYARIKQFALREKKQRIYERWVQELREDVYLDVRPAPGDYAASAP